MTYTIRNSAMYALGLGFMALAWSKDKLSGYSTPNTVAKDDVGGRIEYVHDIYDSWSEHLPADFDVRDKDVLELCPGSSRGAGALFLAHGARSYHAIDVYPLAATETPEFYELVLDCAPDGDLLDEDEERARAITGSRTSEEFSYSVGRDFDIPRLAEGRRFDLIVSCAAFEHYDDIEKTIEDCTAVARSGCQSAHIVDFQTHSRWIRERDPNNIYRYPEELYRMFAFPGQPNRKRPKHYADAFRTNGWTDIEVKTACAVDPALEKASLAGLAAPFDDPAMDMRTLHGVVLARMP